MLAISPHTVEWRYKDTARRVGFSKIELHVLGAMATRNITLEDIWPKAKSS
jgi:hypothetical protein